jgi:hypothetical protein
MGGATHDKAPSPMSNVTQILSEIESGDSDAAERLPAIVPVQDYAPYVSEGAEFKYGHGLVVIGVCLGYVLCQDSSADNVAQQSGTIRRPGWVMIDQQTFRKNWHDRYVQGKEHVGYGIAVSKPNDQAECLDETSGSRWSDCSPVLRICRCVS